MQKRRHRRFTKRIEAEFMFGDRKIVGISSDLSERGLFVRTRYPLAMGSAIDLTLYLPGGKTARAQGVVRRAVKSQSTLIKSGMGIELSGYDDIYADFMSNVVGQKVAYEGMADVEYKAMRGGPDRVDTPDEASYVDAAEAEPSEPPTSSSQEKPEVEIIACPSCGVKNKIPAGKLSLGPRCGKCKSPLTV
jgi:hypothetical protein